MCEWDIKQQAIDIQYFTVFFEIFMLVSLYLGNSFIKVFALVAYCLRIIIVIIWGSILMYRYEDHIGVKIGNSTNEAD
jgi:hypothetical protein